MTDSLITFIKEEFLGQVPIPLCSPKFEGNERKYVLETIESSFVSSVGTFVDRFEDEICKVVSSPYAIACVNGTSALHVALVCSGVEKDDLVITQAMTFVATCNAISYCGAEPVFVDVARTTLSMCPQALNDWLDKSCFLDGKNVCRHKSSGRRVKACVPVHTFGMVADMTNILSICDKWHLSVIEDAAEALGSYQDSHAAGTMSPMGVLSFNGNKIITTGGGGIVLAKSEEQAKRVKHLTTTGKKMTGYAMYHDELAFNYRMPNINAALGVAQLENLEELISAKRQRAERYKKLFNTHSLDMIIEPSGCTSNYWLVCALCESETERETYLKKMDNENITARPVWTLMHKLPMYSSCERDDLKNAQFFESRLINLPN